MKRFLLPLSAFAFKNLQRIFGTDVRSFAKNAMLASTSHGVSMLRGIVTGYVVTRFFPREILGQYQFILSIMGFIGILSIPGITNALSRAVARGDKEAVIPVARAQLIASTMGSFVLVAAIPFLQYFDRSELWPLFLVAALLFPLSHVSATIFSALTIGQADFRTPLRANIVWSIIMVIVTTAIILLQPSALLLFTAATALPAIIYATFSRPLLPVKENTSSTREIVRYGWDLSLVSLPISLSWYLDKLLISGLLGLNQLAVFSAALLIPEQVKVWSKELLPVSFATQARGTNSRERRRRLILIVGRATLLLFPGLILYAALAPFFFPILLPNYPDAVFLTQLAAFTLVTQPSALFTQYLEARAMLKALRITQWISATVFCISLLTLLPTFGLAGAIAARGILRLSYALCSLWFLMREDDTAS